MFYTEGRKSKKVTDTDLGSVNMVDLEKKKKRHRFKLLICSRVSTSSLYFRFTDSSSDRLNPLL